MNNRKMALLCLILIGSISILIEFNFEVTNAESKELKVPNDHEQSNPESMTYVKSIRNSLQHSVSYLSENFSIIQWNQTYGSQGPEEARTVIQTENGEYMVMGFTYPPGLTGRDVFLMQTNVNGIVKWNQTYGALEFDDLARSAIQTDDGGLAMVGFTYESETGNSDIWFFKTDANGELQWNHHFGGGYCYHFGDEPDKCSYEPIIYYFDTAYSVIQTADNGYAIIGWTSQLDIDAWLLRTNENGEILWNQTYDLGVDRAHSVIQTLDNGFVFAGSTQSSDMSTRDFWLLKTDANGITQWNHTFNYDEQTIDEAQVLIQTNDGGFAMLGLTRSLESDNSDAWLIKTNEFGEPQWNRTYSGLGIDQPFSMIQTRSDAFAIVGVTRSMEKSSTDSGVDVWLVYTDKDGEQLWNYHIGGVEDDWAYSIIQAEDGGLVIAGSTRSYREGSLDAWILKTIPLSEIPQLTQSQSTPIIPELSESILLISTISVAIVILVVKKTKNIRSK